MTAKIGIGVITMQNRDIHPNLLNLISQPTSFYIHTDYERNGPGYGRNECIKHLYDAGCEYFFIFDDDTYPVIKGWQDYFISRSLASGIHAFAYPHRAKYIGPIAVIDDIEFWQWCTTPFQYLTRKMVDTVGYYNLAYDRYGYEDVAYLYRARTSGLCGTPQGDPAPKEIDMYIHSMDLLGGDANFSAEANMSFSEKNAYAELNHAEFKKEVSSGKLYYPYDQ